MKRGSGIGREFAHDEIEGDGEAEADESCVALGRDQEKGATWVRSFKWRLTRKPGRLGRRPARSEAGQRIAIDSRKRCV
jgi:hypothetical protein